MSGIYIHIPFCKQACHYCDFHFSTSLKKKEPMLRAIHKELLMRSVEAEGTQINTIYFGGGTPSVLDVEEIEEIIATVTKNYHVNPDAEITLEANPDDLTKAVIDALARSPINRLSIGVQSFFEEDLRLMNRAHNAKQAIESLAYATQFFENISLDLIYGIPEMSEERWRQNIQQAIDLGVVHISSYALTVEPDTALERFVAKGIVKPIDEALAQRHFEILLHTLSQAGYIHYELSNFGKEGFFSRNNTAYWQRKNYLGIGPSAHSYDGKHRSWNIANNTKYIQQLTQDQLPSEIETLTKIDRYNEQVMTGLRTMWGVSLVRLREEFGSQYEKYLLEQSEKYISQHLLYIDAEIIRTTRRGKFLSDGIAADLFMINLE